MKMLLALVLVAATSGSQNPPTVYKPGDGVSLPRVIRQVKADYTNEARDQRIEGTVVMDILSKVGRRFPTSGR